MKEAFSHRIVQKVVSSLYGSELFIAVTPYLLLSIVWKSILIFWVLLKCTHRLEQVQQLKQCIFLCHA